jgi:hypothetical protein
VLLKRGCRTPFEADGTLYLSKLRGPRHKVRRDTVVATYLRSHDWTRKDISAFLGIPLVRLLEGAKKAGLLVRRPRRRLRQCCGRRHFHIDGVVASYPHKNGAD